MPIGGTTWKKSTDSQKNLTFQDRQKQEEIENMNRSATRNEIETEI